MAIIPVSEWIPDAAALGNPGSVNIENAVPGSTSYGPFPAFVSRTGALTARPRGAIEALDDAANVFNFAGDATKLYKLTGTTWGDVSKVGGYSTGDTESWEFVRWRNKVLATNWNDSPQFIEFSGSLFADLTTAFKARHLGVVRNFVVAANTNDSTDGDVRDRIRWCASGDETDWTVSPTTGADIRTLRVGGGIQSVVSGDYGVVVSERSLFRMTFAGAPLWFQIDEVAPGIGTQSPGSVVRLGDTTFLISESGVVALVGGARVEYPGGQKVDKFLRSDIDDDYLGRVSAVADPRSKRILWAYPGPGNVSGRPNRILIYDITTNKFSQVGQELELIWRAGGVATTMEELDTAYPSLDDLDISLDSAQWKGGSPLLSAFDSSFQHGSFSGSSMTGLVETKETEIFPGRRAMLTGFRPLVDGGSVTAQVGTRNTQNEAVTWSDIITPRTSGLCAVRSLARYHRFRLHLAGDWTNAMGVDVSRDNARQADRR